MKKLSLVSLLGIVWFLSSTAMAANLGSVVIKITDTQGKPIEGVTFTMVDETYGTKHVFKTDAQGKFKQLGLPPGLYKVTIEKEGFQSLVSDFRVRLGKPAETVVVLEKLEAVAPEMIFKLGNKEISPQVKEKYEKGLEAYKAAKFGEAKTLFEEAIALMPDLPEPYFYLYDLYKKEGQKEKAVEMIKKGLELKPDWAQAHLKLAYEMEEANNADGAEQEYRKTIELEPNSADAHKAMYEEAKQHLNTYLELNPNASDKETILSITKELETLAKKTNK
jgi:tetratricopeptide (TPR) repeat protein